MKNGLPSLFLTVLLSGSFNVMAQNWVNGGNALTTNGSLGTTSNFSVLFKSNNSERGRITNNGLWGFGIITPNAKVHISSPSGQVPLRVEENGFTKLLVKNGVTIGSTATPPANGLYVIGNTGIGTSLPENKLHVFKGSAGTVTGFINAPLIVENSTSSYINILAPDIAETGILFGKPASNVSGAIIYNNSSNLNGLLFRTNNSQIQMALTASGNLGIGTINPGIYKLAIRHGGGGLGGISIENSNLMQNWDIFNGGDLLLSWDHKFVGSFNPFTGAYTPISDERLKDNIKPMGAMLKKIRELKPSTYQFKNSKDNQEYNGFIAQDVIKIFPAMVKHHMDPERKLDVYTMDYGQVGVLAIKGIQELLPVIEEQEKINEEQKLKISLLEDRLAKLEATLGAGTVNNNVTGSAVITNASLEQNEPNPFGNNTTIRYNMPEGSQGQINIYDQTGKIVKVMTANESNRLELRAHNLPAGTYTYSLVINGRVFLSKQMVIIK